MENSSKSCWSQCWWCIFTCNGTRISRVTPENPFPVVSASGRKDQDLAEARAANQAKPLKKAVQTGTINQFFVPDENLGENEQGGCNKKERTEVSQELSTISDYHLQNSIFIEIDKERRIRVVHLEPKPLSLGENGLAQSPHYSPDHIAELPVSSPEHLSPQRKAPDEEDEYWFSKWTRKPRFRSIFEKNTIHGSEEEESENNNSVNEGTLSKDFEVARAAAAAKRRAWAYSNETAPVVQKGADPSEEEEFNSIAICDTSQKWSKNGKTDPNDSSTLKTPPNTPRNNSTDIASGVTNFGFEEDVCDSEVIREMAVDCPPDFVSPVKSLSLKRGGPSPSPSSSSSTKMFTDNSKDLNSIEHAHASPGSLIVQTPTEIIPKCVNKCPIIFFIHGISGSSEVWKAQMDYFQNLGYEIVAPDLLGHGYSSTPNNGKYYKFESLAQDLLSVFDYFVQEDRKSVLIGHGYGASLAAVISRVRPKNSTVLISISGGGPTPFVKRSCCRSSLLPFYCQLFHTNPTKGRFDDPVLRHVLPSIIHKHVIKGQVWTDGDSAFYRRITVPTLLVYGMKDKVVNLVEVCEMERTIPKSFLEVIDSSGHMVMLDSPLKLNNMLGKFIQSWV